jgi:hypothetical protein
VNTSYLRWGAYAAWLVALLICCFMVDGSHGWSDDGSQYLLHARNLLEGRPYAQLPFAYTPAHTDWHIYPPVLPAMLAVIVAFRGLDFVAFKILMVVIFFGCLAILPRSFRDYLDWRAMVVVVLLFGANPNLWAQTSHINSDFLALFFIIALVAVVESGSSNRLLFAAVLIILAVNTRSATIAVVPALLLHASLRRDRGLALSAISGAAVALAIPYLVGSHTASYLPALLRIISVRSIRRNLIQFVTAPGEFFGLPAAAAIGIWLVILYGLWRYLRDRGLGTWECIALLYAAELLVWPYSDPLRFGLPLLPLLLVYLLHGVEGLLPSKAVPVYALLLICSGFLYWREYRASPRDANAGIFGPSSLELWDYVKGNIPPDAVIVFRKARTLALLTGRKSVEYSTLPTTGQMRSEVCFVHPTYIIYAPALFDSDRDLLKGVISNDPAQMKRVFQNQVFSVYAVQPHACDGAPPPVFKWPSRWSRDYPLL